MAQPSTDSPSRRTFLAAIGATAIALTYPRSSRATAPAPERSPTPSLPSTWQLQSAAIAAAPGDQISQPGYAAKDWYPVTVPSTVLAALVAAGEYPDLFYSDNLKRVPKDRFKSSWWYRTTFTLPTSADAQHWLTFKGINYRANVWLNGQKIADSQTLVGAYRDFTFNITPHLNPDGQPNTLAVEVFRPNPKTDLTITFVDWAPEPPDLNMGLWQDVPLHSTGPVLLTNAHVLTDLDVPSLATAKLTIEVDATNATKSPITATVRARIESIDIIQSVVLAPHETKPVTFGFSEHPELVLHTPRVWQPWQLGSPDMYDLAVSVFVDEKPSDALATSFGIRHVTSRLENGALLFTVNGTDLLILGGGYAPDLLQRRANQEEHFRYTRDMNLNTIRLEGKLEDDAFYSLADRYGILLMPGWCCCSPWEKWKNWKDEQHTVATESLRTQIRRARTHPSMLVWLNGSDNHPPEAIEKEYLAIEKDLNWPAPTLSSATAKKAASGPSGVKMEGPYKWVPPIYWYTDTKKGGAHGFNTEVGPGAVPSPVESLESFLPPDHRWPLDGIAAFHCGGGSFSSIKDFTDALDARFGPSKSLVDFSWKSQLQAYETIRAMFEAFRRNKFNSGGTATGEIQWMLNNAWPSLIWHLYDYSLRPGAAYFATKLACEPLHILYGYENQTISVANDTLQSQVTMATADVYDLAGKKLHTQSGAIDAHANKTTAAFTLPKLDLPPSYILRLTLASGMGEKRPNTYFLSSKPDVLEFDKEDKDDWNITRCSAYTDYTALQSLPPSRLALTEVTHVPGRSTARVTNTSDVPALLVRLKLLQPDSSEELLPIRWQDNYFTLLPNESRNVAATYLPSDLRPGSPNIIVDCFNNRG